MASTSVLVQPLQAHLSRAEYAYSEKYCKIFCLVKTSDYLNERVYCRELSLLPSRSEFKDCNSSEIIGKWDC